MKLNNLENRIPDASTLIQYNQYNTGKQVENKICDVSDLVKKTDYDTKIKDIKGKYFTTVDYNKFTSDIFDAKVKQKHLVDESKISNVVKNL